MKITIKGNIKEIAELLINVRDQLPKESQKVRFSITIGGEDITISSEEAYKAFFEAASDGNQKGE